MKAYTGPLPAQVLMARLAGLGVLFLLRDGRLEVDAPRGVLSNADRAALVARKAELTELVCWEITKTDGRSRDAAPASPPPPPAPLADLKGPRRTAWETLVWSDPDEPAIELFGPPPTRETPR